MIDTHAHIYLPEFANDQAGMIQRAKDAGVKKILMPGPRYPLEVYTLSRRAP